jgi:hypothetical protein
MLTILPSSAVLINTTACCEASPATASILSKVLEVMSEALSMDPVALASEMTVTCFTVCDPCLLACLLACLFACLLAACWLSALFSNHFD